MKYILMLSGEEIGRFKSFEEASESAKSSCKGRSADYIQDYYILEVVSEFQMTVDKQYSFKEKKF